MPIDRFDAPYDEEPWSVQIEYDMMTVGQPFVVTVLTCHNDGDKESETLITPGPDTARMMADSLVRAADKADLANRRREQGND